MKKAFLLFFLFAYSFSFAANNQPEATVQSVFHNSRTRYYDLDRSHADAYVYIENHTPDSVQVALIGLSASNVWSLLANTHILTPYKNARAGKDLFQSKNKLISCPGFKRPLRQLGMLFSKDDIDVRISESQGNLCIYLYPSGYAYAQEEVEREDLYQESSSEDEMDSEVIKEKFQQLKVMYDEGLISENEYNAKRAQLLERM